MNIPEKCKDCVFFQINNDNIIKCMLGHSLNLANGCPNKKINNYIE